MPSNKMIFFAVISSFFSFLLMGLSTTLKANDNLDTQTILVAEAHQHDHKSHSQEKKDSTSNSNHQHEQNKENGHSHDKDKTSKHSHQKNEKNEHQHGMMEDKHDYAHMIIFHADELKLTNDQLGRLVRLHLKHEKEHKKIKEKLKESMHAFKKAKMDPSSTDEQLANLGKDHANAFNAMVEHHIQERRAIHNVLSADQKSQLNTIKMDHSAHDTKDGGHNH